MKKQQARISNAVSFAVAVVVLAVVGAMLWWL